MSYQVKEGTVKKNLPYKNPNQVHMLRAIKRPVRRYGDHSKDFIPKSLSVKVV